MGLSVVGVGGHGEVGKNCTAIIVDDEIFLLDLGLHLDNYVRVTQDEESNARIQKDLLIKEHTIPDLSLIDKEKVKAVLISHAHLDHVGAIPYLAKSLSCDIYGTPFTMALAKRLCEDKKIELHQELRAKKFNKRFKLSRKVKAEFIEVTHSTPHSAAIVLYTPYGVVVYLNDFKLEGEASRKALEKLKKLKPTILILDTLYANNDSYTPGEEVAKSLLEGALLSRDIQGKNLLVSTFASHILRIQTLVKIAHQLNRKVMIVGRSIAKYLEAAKEVGLSDIIDDEQVIKYGSRINRALKKVNHTQDYLFIVTGGMGESKAVLSRIVDDELLLMKRGDIVVFSNKVIPTPAIIAARKNLEKKLARRGAEILCDLHVSGHGARQDHLLVLDALRPHVLIPVHGDNAARESIVKLAKGFGIETRLLVVGETFSL